jgi:hypothetical protein
VKTLLFISWDGPQVGYLEGLFLPILQGLSGEYRMHIVQFTWGPGDGDRVKTLLEKAGMVYHRYEIRRKPFVVAGVLLTLFLGKRYLRRYIREQKIDVVLPRSIFPALMVSGQAARDRSRRWVLMPTVYRSKSGWILRG